MYAADLEWDMGETGFDKINYVFQFFSWTEIISRRIFEEFFYEWPSGCVIFLKYYIKQGKLFWNMQNLFNFNILLSTRVRH